MALNAIVHRRRSAWWERFLRAPCIASAQALYAQRQRLITHTDASRSKLGINVVCISDTYNQVCQLPFGDLLIHAGDLTHGGTSEELQAQLDWLNSQPHKYRVVIAGNHDLVLDERASADLDQKRFCRESLRWGSIIYLEKSSTTLSFPTGIKLSVFGHPGTPRHGNWAFQHDRKTDVFSQQAEDDIDIFVTHSAPRFHLDVDGWGDAFLLRELWRIKPRLSVFGHIHEGHGRETLVYDRFEYLYEQVYAGQLGLFALFQMIILLFWMQLQDLTGCSDNMEQTVLVNASMVGGLRDKDVRRAQVVRL